MMWRNQSGNHERVGQKNRYTITAAMVGLQVPVRHLSTLIVSTTGLILNAVAQHIPATDPALGEINQNRLMVTWGATDSIPTGGMFLFISRAA